MQSWELRENSYRITSVMETVGLAALLRPTRMESESRGRIVASGLAPEALQAAYAEEGILGVIRSTGDDRVRTSGNSNVTWDNLPTRVQIQMIDEHWQAIAKPLKDGKKVVLEFDIRNTADANETITISAGSGGTTSGIGCWCSKPCSGAWNETDMMKICRPCCCALTRRVEKLAPSRTRSTS